MHSLLRKGMLRFQFKRHAERRYRILRRRCRGGSQNPDCSIVWFTRQELGY
jgi:hypothetical protein